VPPGSYKISSGPLSPVYGLHLQGAGADSTQISCTGSALFNTDPATGLTPSNGNLENVEIDHLTLNVTGGDIFWGANIVRSSVHHCQLIQNSLGNAIWNMSPSTGQGTTYMAECQFYANKEIVNTVGTRTINPWYLNAQGPNAANDNWWYGNWLFNNSKDATQWWYRIIGAVSGSYGSRNNRFEKLLFEYPLGGMIRLESVTGCTIADCTNEDLAALTAGSNAMISLGSVSGSTTGCIGTTISKYVRRGGTAISSPDIQLDPYCQNTRITDPEATYGNKLIIDLGSSQAVWLAGLDLAVTADSASAPQLLNAAGATWEGQNGAVWTPASSPQPEDAGYIGWSFDSVLIGTAGTALPVAGVLYLIKIPLRGLLPLSNIDLYLEAGGTGLTAGCFTGAYSSAGVLISTSADQHSAWGAAGPVTAAQAGAPYAAGQGFIWAGLIFNGTTGPSVAVAHNQSNGLANGQAAAAATRFGSYGSGYTALPATIVPGNIARQPAEWWAGAW
jgi:hypothetical protein